MLTAELWLGIEVVFYFDAQKHKKVWFQNKGPHFFYDFYLTRLTPNSATFVFLLKRQPLFLQTQIALLKQLNPGQSHRFDFACLPNILRDPITAA